MTTRPSSPPRTRTRTSTSSPRRRRSTSPIPAVALPARAVTSSRLSLRPRTSMNTWLERMPARMASCERFSAFTTVVGVPTARAPSSVASWLSEPATAVMRKPAFNCVSQKARPVSGPDVMVPLITSMAEMRAKSVFAVQPQPMQASPDGRTGWLIEARPWARSTWLSIAATSGARGLPSWKSSGAVTPKTFMWPWKVVISRPGISSRSL